MLSGILVLAFLPRLQDTPGSWLDRFQGAQAFVQAGRFDEAVGAFESCLELAPQNPTTGYHIACAQARAGRAELALEWLSRAVDWGYRDAAVMQWDPDLAGLRASPGWAGVLARVLNGEGPEDARRIRAWHPTGHPHLSPNGRWAATYDGGTILVRDLATGEVWTVIELGGEALVSWMQFEDEGEVLVVRDRSGAFSAWDVDTGAALERTTWPKRRLREEIAALIPREELRFTLPAEWRRTFSVSSSEPYRLADADTGAVLREWAHGFSGQGTCFESAVGLLAVVGPGPITEIVEPRSGVTEYTLRGGAIGIAWPLVLPDDRTALVLASDGSPRGIDLRTGETAWLLPAWTQGELEIPKTDRLIADVPDARGVAVSRDGTVVAASSDDGAIHVWSIPERRETATLPGRPPRYFELHPSGTHLAVWDAGETAFVWSTESRSIAYEVPDDGGVTLLVWSPDGKWLASGHRDGTARLWDAETGEGAGAPMVHGGIVRNLAFDSAGERLASGDATSLVRVWEVPAGRPAMEIRLVGGGAARFDACGYIAWTPQGDILATTAWPSVHLFDGRHGTQRWMLDYDGGNEATFFALPGAGGERAYLSGMVTAHSRVVGLDTGEVIADLGQRELWDLSGTSDGELVLAEAGGLVVLDGATFEERYRRYEFSDGASLISLPCGIHCGTPVAVRATRILLAGATYPLDGFAPVLYDPRRVRAAAQGVPIRRPELPTPPRIASVAPAGRTVTVSAADVMVTVVASGPKVLGFQVERDGEVLPMHPRGSTFEARGETSTLIWPVERRGSDETRLRLRAVGRTGVLSRPALLTLRWN